MIDWDMLPLGTPGLLLVAQPGYACGQKDVDGGVPHLRMNNVSKNGSIDMTLIRRIPGDVAEAQGRFLEIGDVILNNTNSTELVGKSCIFPGWEERCAFSNHLTKLRPNPERMLPQWLHCCLRNLWCDGFFATSCTEFVGQSAFNKNTLLAVEIPVPPLAEQRRIVGRIEALTKRAEKLRLLNGSLVEDMSAALASLYGEMTEDADQVPFCEVARLARRRVDVTADGTYPELGIRSFGNGTFPKPTLSGKQLGNKKIYQIRAGDLMLMIIFAWEGAIAVARPEDEGRVASHRFLSHEVDTSRATAEFLCYYLLSPDGIEHIRAASPGSAGRNRTLSTAKLKRIPVPLPPISEQVRFARLFNLRVNLQRLQREVEAELAAFTPALLAKAFRGEL